MENTITLKEAVDAIHRTAERTALAQSMIRGTLDINLYYQFLYNMREIYAAIERRIPDLPKNIVRVDHYDNDIRELNLENGQIVPTVAHYVSYIELLGFEDVWAHTYVHYLGNMYGGQMIKQRMPGPATHLDFENTPDSIAYIRAKIANISHEEAIRSFEWTIRIYDELYKTFGQNSPTS
jgi:heme oxygenase